MQAGTPHRRRINCSIGKRCRDCNRFATTPSPAHDAAARLYLSTLALPLSFHWKRESQRNAHIHIDSHRKKRDTDEYQDTFAWAFSVSPSLLSSHPLSPLSLLLLLASRRRRHHRRSSFARSSEDCKPLCLSLDLATKRAAVKRDFSFILPLFLPLNSTQIIPLSVGEERETAAEQRDRP